MVDPKLITTLPDGKICDFIDGTIRNDTPEEYVRQNILRRLVKELGYKPERIEANRLRDKAWNLEQGVLALLAKEITT